MEKSYRNRFPAPIKEPTRIKRELDRVGTVSFFRLVGVFYIDRPNFKGCTSQIFR